MSPPLELQNGCLDMGAPRDRSTARLVRQKTAKVSVRGHPYQRFLSFGMDTVNSNKPQVEASADHIKSLSAA
jgi:hypothetical protein